MDGYSIQDLNHDMEILILNGFVEIKGVDEKGELLYGVTEKSQQLEEDELMRQIIAALHPGDNL